MCASSRASLSVWMQWEKPIQQQTACREPPSSSTHLPSASLRLVSASAQTPPRLPPLATCSTSTPRRSLLLRYTLFFCFLCATDYVQIELFKIDLSHFSLSVFAGPQWEGHTLPASPVCTQRSQCGDTGVQLCIYCLLRLLYFAGIFFCMTLLFI